jgi:hypothetical protein
LKHYLSFVLQGQSQRSYVPVGPFVRLVKASGVWGYSIYNPEETKAHISTLVLYFTPRLLLELGQKDS